MYIYTRPNPTFLNTPIGVEAQSTLRWQAIFAPKYMYKNLQNARILCAAPPKWNALILHDICPKNNFSRFVFFLGGGGAAPLVFYAYMYSPESFEHIWNWR